MERTWWKEAVVYQIYPRSFRDSNGDGIGDIPGILEKLDYLKDLGIDVIWLSPVYQSPNADNGYDISDYRDIQPEFGTMEDLRRLIDGLHMRGMKLVMDLVVNHTSDEHPWFLEAKKSKDNPYRDYYIWRDPVDGGMPNNWESHFSGPVWEWDEETKQYYLHIFSKKQPDLNWENPKVRDEVKKIASFWLEQGIDGFRMDVINFISKVPGLPKVEGVDGLVRAGKYYMNGPRVHEYLHELNRDVLSKYDIMTVGETSGVSPQIALDYVGYDREELQTVFQFEHTNLDNIPNNKWVPVPLKISKFKETMSRWQTMLYGKGWNSLFIENHDQPRSVSRFGNDGPFWEKSAKMLGTMIFTMQGTPYIYQGQEIGMTNVRYESIGDYRDIQSLNLYKDLTDKGYDDREIMEKIYRRGRDNARTPMQWNDEISAGFSEGTPWIKVNDNYTRINVKDQKGDSNSILSYYKGLIRMRKKYPTLVYGKFREFMPENEELYVYSREDENGKIAVILNFTDHPVCFAAPDEWRDRAYTVIGGNYPDRVWADEMELRPYEAVVAKADTAVRSDETAGVEIADKIVVLDDDPTGVQTVHDVPVYTDWSGESILRGFQEEGRVFYILTNSRAFTEEETAKVHREIAERVVKASRKTGKSYAIISRGDSTLRGHYPLETRTIAETLRACGEKEPDGEIICPFFLEGGRITAGDIHYVRLNGKLVPAGETEFAKDKTFGYSASDLKEYVEEKTKGAVKKEQVISISLEDLRQGRPEAAYEKLMGLHSFGKAIVNAKTYEDLDVFVEALKMAVRDGKHFLYRTAASFVRVAGGINARPLLTRDEMVDGKNANGGIIVVGSHTKKTTEQLVELEKIPGLETIEFNSDLVDEPILFREEIERVLKLESEYIAAGKTVVVYTKRKLLVKEGDTKETALLRSVKISDALCSLVGELAIKPSFIIAKGGITSSDVGVKALKVKRAWVLGQVKPGIPVWKTDGTSKFGSMPYVIFPGNVGEKDTLKEIAKILLK